MRLNSDQVTVKVRSGHGGQEHRGFLLGLELAKLRDWEQAAEQYQEAADAGDRDAAVNLAVLQMQQVMSQTGQFMKHLGPQLEALQELAETDHPQACLALSYLYELFASEDGDQEMVKRSNYWYARAQVIV